MESRLPHKQRHFFPPLNPLKTPHETTHVSGEGDEERPGEEDADVVVELLLKRHLALLWGRGVGREVKGDKRGDNGLLVNQLGIPPPPTLMSNTRMK